MFRALRGLIRKEFIQIFRDKIMLRLIVAMPLIQMVLFGYVANTEVKYLDLDIYDFDQSPLSRDLINSCRAGDYFVPNTTALPLKAMEAEFASGRSEMALVIPVDFSERMQKGERVAVGLISDGTNANSTAIGISYMAQIAQKFTMRQFEVRSPVSVSYRMLYNPEVESVYFMVPGIVAALLTMITVILTSMAVVRERENGTLEQLLVTPISSMTLLFGKTIPFAVLGLVELVIALAVGIIWFGIPFMGSPLLLVGLSLLYLLTTLGVGLFFSTVTSTQQQAMFFAWFFSIFALLTSGFFTPIANMPSWMQTLTYINPMRFFTEIARGIILKGSTAIDLWPNIYPLIIFGVVIFGFAAMRFTKRAA